MNALCLLSVLVMIPSIVNTDTLIIANENPVQANNIITFENEFPKYICRHPIKTTAYARSIPVLNPNFGRKEPTKKATIAIVKSFAGSRKLAFTPDTP